MRREVNYAYKFGGYPRSRNPAMLAKIYLAEMGRSSIVRALARIMLGCIFVYASIDKLAFPEEFAKVIEGYRMVPVSLVPALSNVLPWIELFLGALLVGGVHIRAASRVALAILSIFLIAVCVQALAGRLEDCGCFGKSSFLSTPNIGIMVFRDLAFLSLAAFVALSNKAKSM